MYFTAEALTKSIDDIIITHRVGLSDTDYVMTEMLELYGDALDPEWTRHMVVCRIYQLVGEKVVMEDPIKKEIMEAMVKAIRAALISTRKLLKTKPDLKPKDRVGMFVTSMRRELNYNDVWHSKNEEMQPYARKMCNVKFWHDVGITKGMHLKSMSGNRV